jgi:hypothetical protein
MPKQSVILRSANSRADRFDGVKSPILRGGLYILVCLSAPLSSVTLFSTNPAPATSPPRKNSGAFSSVNSTSIFRSRQSERNLCLGGSQRVSLGEHFSYWIKVQLHFAIAFCISSGRLLGISDQANGAVTELWGPWTALSRLVSPNRGKSKCYLQCSIAPPCEWRTRRK